jgi:hypothetical protein
LIFAPDQSRQLERYVRSRHCATNELVERESGFGSLSECAKDRDRVRGDNPVRSRGSIINKCPYQKLYPAILVMQAAEDRV